jgi:hypothetical protein
MLPTHPRVVGIRPERRPAWAGIVAVVLPVVVALVAGAGHAAAASYTWNTDASGNWSDAGNWSPVGVPTGYDASAAIQRDPAMSVVVTLAGGGALNSLTLDPGNTLQIGYLSFGKTALTAQPTIQNNGSIVIGQSGVLRADGDLSTWTGYELAVRGEGEIRLGSGGSISPVNFGRVTFDIDPVFFTFNSVVGGGEPPATPQIFGWNSTIPTINRALIVADNGHLRVSNLRNEPTAWNGVTYGGILAARNHGTLELTGAITGGTILPTDAEVWLDYATLRNTTIGPGATSVLGVTPTWDACTLLPGAEVRIAAGNRLDLYNSIITNDGTLRVEPGGYLKNFQSQAVLQGTGRVVLANPNGMLEADGTATNWFINQDGHTIEGGGTITAWIANFGTVLANDQTLTVWGNLFGAGEVRIEGQDASHLATLSYQATSALTTGSLLINEFGRLLLASTTGLNVLDEFSFALRDETAWPFASEVLTMTGDGSWQELEVGGEDLGPVAAGFTNNFQHGTLRVEAGANVFLNDAVDNGNRHSPEALYVQNLVLEPGATLNLNGIRLYTYVSPSGTPQLVMIDESNVTEYRHLFAGTLTSWSLSGVGGPPAGGLALRSCPNPFVNATRIEFNLPEAAQARLDVFDVNGRHVAGLFDGVLPAGPQAVEWGGETARGRRASAGVYYGVLTAERTRTVTRLVLSR